MTPVFGICSPEHEDWSTSRQLGFSSVRRSTTNRTRGQSLGTVKLHPNGANYRYQTRTLLLQIGNSVTLPLLC